MTGVAFGKIEMVSRTAEQRKGGEAFLLLRAVRIAKVFLRICIGYSLRIENTVGC